MGYVFNWYRVYVLRLIILIIFLFFTSYSHSSNYYFSLISKRNINEIKQLNLINVYTLKDKYWNDNEEIILVVMNNNNIMHQNFVKYVLKINYISLSKIWDIKKFSGMNLNNIIVVNTKEEMIEYVKNNENAIGYICCDKEKSLTNYEINF